MENAVDMAGDRGSAHPLLVNGTLYGCDGGCGFRGLFDEVARHELACPLMLARTRRRQGLLSSPAAPRHVGYAIALDRTSREPEGGAMLEPEVELPYPVSSRADIAGAASPASPSSVHSQPPLSPLRLPPPPSPDVPSESAQSPRATSAAHAAVLEREGFRGGLEAVRAVADAGSLLLDGVRSIPELVDVAMGLRTGKTIPKLEVASHVTSPAVAPGAPGAEPKSLARGEKERILAEARAQISWSTRKVTVEPDTWRAGGNRKVHTRTIYIYIYIYICTRIHTYTYTYT